MGLYTDIENLLRGINIKLDTILCNVEIDAITVTEGAPVTDGTTVGELRYDPDTNTLYVWDGSSWETIGGGGAAYLEVTYAEAETLIAADGLVPGTLYKITDRGDRGIFLEAISVNQFSITGQRIMLIPVDYENNATVTYNSLPYTSKSIFNPLAATNSDYILDTLVIWNAHYWLQTDGIANTGLPSGTSIQEDLPVGWIRIEKTDPLAVDLYVEKVFDIKYDFDNDWIFEQSDEYNNVVGIDKDTYNSLVLSLPANPVDYTDWGLQDLFSGFTSTLPACVDNKCSIGFYNNSVYNLVEDGDNINIAYNDVPFIIYNTSGTSADLLIQNNLSNGIFLDAGVIGNAVESGAMYIRRNNFSMSLSFNIGYEDISDNIFTSLYSNICSGGGNITKNKAYEISDNTCAFIDSNIVLASIRSNSISDGIYENIYTGDISFNTSPITEISNNGNLGDITGNTNDGGIIRNSNSGTISGNSNGGDINYNINNGVIDSNQHNGNISYNSNNGYIKDCAGAGGFSVINNINNGNIDNPAGLAAADVTDVIVNK